MNFHRRPSWFQKESAVTSESKALNRRAILGGAGALAVAAGGAGLVASLPGGAEAAPGEPWTPTPPQHPSYRDAGRPVTPEEINSTYNNFYEFGSHKQISGRAEALVTDPWTIEIDGHVGKPGKIAFEDLIRRMPIDERIYRHRCVEAWSMVAPWIGFPLAALVREVEPTSDAKYVRFETILDPDMMPGQRQSWYPWPYVEGVTMAEATNPLSYMVVGAYGKELHKSFGAPLRLHLPWKYGFKSIKSIARISFTSERPVSFWEELLGAEYGFWANVNPEVDHPRWSQATERVLQTGDRIPTQLFNGYGAEVAHLYKDMDQSGRALWM